MSWKVIKGTREPHRSVRGRLLRVNAAARFSFQELNFTKDESLQMAALMARLLKGIMFHAPDVIASENGAWDSS